MKRKNPLWSLMALVLMNCILQAQQFTNWNFESNTPTPNVFNCNVAPWGWSASTSPSAVQWENRWNSSWWIDLTDCNGNNGRWIEQTVYNMNPGQTYYLYFDLGTNLWSVVGLDLYIDNMSTPVANFIQPNDGIHDIRWRTFIYCFTATSTSHTFRFAAAIPNNGWAAIVAFDNAYLGSVPNFTLNVPDTCVPVLLTRVGPIFGTSNWYYNGGFLSSGSDSLYATLPGLYTLKYITACGDTITKDTVLVNCDTCDIKTKANYFCVDDSTVFTFDPPQNCLDSNCIGEMDIDFGDGMHAFSPGGKARFAHKYPGPGIYTVINCWMNRCTGVRTCDTLVIEIIECGECQIRPDFEFDECIPVKFTNTSTSNYHVLGINWSFGDGSSSTANNPVHAYAAPGQYYVCLTIITAGPRGQTCKQTICKWITVRFCENGGPDARPVGLNNPGAYTDMMKILNIKVFPNPARDEISISGLVPGSTGITITLYDITGRILMQRQIDESKDTYNLSLKDLEQGTYILSIKGDTYSKEVKLIKE